MRSRLFAVSATALLAACTCGQDPVVKGTVVDLWDVPVDGITVSLADGAKTTSDAQGQFTLPMAASLDVGLAGQGYIPRTTTITPTSTEEDFATQLQIIPEPATAGYHLVGESSYLPVPGQPVQRVGTDLQNWQGIRSTGDVEVSGTPLQLIFHTPLKMDEVARLDIELHRLTFVETTEIDTVEGKEEVDVNLWISAGKVKYVKAALGSDDNYSFTIDDLPSGTYAFVSMDLLNPKNPEGFSKIAPEVRKVHAFTVN